MKRGGLTGRMAGRAHVHAHAHAQFCESARQRGLKKERYAKMQRCKDAETYGELPRGERGKKTNVFFSPPFVKL